MYKTEASGGGVLCCRDDMESNFPAEEASPLTKCYENKGTDPGEEVAASCAGTARYVTLFQPGFDKKLSIREMTARQPCVGSG